MWSVSSRDWERPAAWIASEVIQRTRPGDVVLMHDGDATAAGDRRAATAQAVRTILKHWNDRGLRALPVSELFSLTA